MRRAPLVLLLSLLPSLAAAQDLVGITKTGQLVSINPTTGLDTPLGPTGLTGCEALTRDAAGVLWAANADTLFSIDPATAMVTSMVPIAVYNVTGLAFDDAGTLWALSKSSYPFPGFVYQIDPGTGSDTFVGSIDGVLMEDFAFRNGLFYGWAYNQGLWTFDPATGISQEVTAGQSPIAGTLRSLAFTHDGRLLGAGKQKLFEIDPVTEALTPIGPGMMAAVRGLGHRDSLVADVDAVSSLLGGVQTLHMLAGPDHAGRAVLLLGSVSGSSPGFPLDDLTVPLNVDAYTLFTAQHPNKGPLAGSLGVLDANGHAAATWTMPAPLPEAEGAVLHHAYVVFDHVPGVSLSAVFASQAVSLTIEH